jgi:hypothetical protein
MFGIPHYIKFDRTSSREKTPALPGPLKPIYNSTRPKRLWPNIEQENFMLSKTIARALTAIQAVLLASALAGCGILAPAVPPTPTPDNPATLEAVSKAILQTVVAGMTQNAPTSTPVTPATPTSTITATITLTPTITETPGPSPTPTHAFIPWTKTPTPTQSPYACAIVDVSPKSGDSIRINQEFTGSWALKNTGTKIWTTDTTDIRYVDGQKLQREADAYDLSGNVAPNGTTTISIPMKSPDGDGTFSTTWGLYMEDGSVCSLPLTINVTK